MLSCERRVAPATARLRASTLNFRTIADLLCAACAANSHYLVTRISSDIRLADFVCDGDRVRLPLLAEDFSAPIWPTEFRWCGRLDPTSHRQPGGPLCKEATATATAALAQDLCSAGSRFSTARATSSATSCSSDVRTTVQSCDVATSDACVQVVVDAMHSVGLDTLASGKQAFMNVTREFLLSDAATLLPKDQVVVELLEDIEVRPRGGRGLHGVEEGWLHAGARRLHLQRGHRRADSARRLRQSRLSGDEHARRPRAGPRRDPAIEADAAGREGRDAGTVRTRPSKKGSSYFQGYYFGRPVTREVKRIPGPSRRLRGACWPSWATRISACSSSNTSSSTTRRSATACCAR